MGRLLRLRGGPAQRRRRRFRNRRHFQSKQCSAHAPRGPAPAPRSVPHAEPTRAPRPAGHAPAAPGCSPGWRLPGTGPSAGTRRPANISGRPSRTLDQAPPGTHPGHGPLPRPHPSCMAFPPPPRASVVQLHTQPARSQLSARCCPEHSARPVRPCAGLQEMQPTGPRYLDNLHRLLTLH